MGLSGSGKSYLSERLAQVLDAVWLNADKVRKEANDWDFSLAGRVRQADRMKKLSQEALASGKHVIADFICPTRKTRENFKPDYIIWMNTILKSKYEDTNEMFENPKENEVNFIIKEKNADLYKFLIADQIDKYQWDDKRPTAQMLGRWQPWHEGHQKLFIEIFKKTGQVNIMVRDIKGVGDNPFNFEEVKQKIELVLKDYKDRIKISLVPNITNICYGRGVGYKIEEIILDEETQKISATKIREEMRKKGEL